MVVFGLQAATRLHKDGITSNRKSSCYGEFVLRPCTHRPSHAGRKLRLKLTGPLTVKQYFLYVVRFWFFGLYDYCGTCN